MKLVFTNGVFDIVHAGHIHLLRKARSLGDILIVGVNSDESAAKLGKRHAIQPFEARVAVLDELRCVDLILHFDEDTPLEVIKEIKPDVLVKGGDWALEDIIGAKEVISWGGQVITVPLLAGFSSSILRGV